MSNSAILARFFIFATFNGLSPEMNAFFLDQMEISNPFSSDQGTVHRKALVLNSSGGHLMTL